jgi:hypothetical protein
MKQSKHQNVGRNLSFYSTKALLAFICNAQISRLIRFFGPLSKNESMLIRQPTYVCVSCPQQSFIVFGRQQATPRKATSVTNYFPIVSTVLKWLRFKSEVDRKTEPFSLAQQWL